MSLSPVERLVIEAELRALCHRFVRLVDAGEVDDLVALFTEDARVESGGSVCAGPEQIRQLFSRPRPAGLTLRHLLTNIDFLEVEADRADAIGYGLTLHTIEPGGNPFTNARFSEFHDHYRRSDRGWLISARTSTKIFGP